MKRTQFRAMMLLLFAAPPLWATRLVTYSIFNETRAGAVEGTYVVDLSRAYAFYLFNG